MNEWMDGHGEKPAKHAIPATRSPTTRHKFNVVERLGRNGTGEPKLDHFNDDENVANGINGVHKRERTE